MSGCIDHGFAANKPQGYHQVRRHGKLQYVHRLAYAEATGIPCENLWRIYNGYTSSHSQTRCL